METTGPLYLQNTLYLKSRVLFREKVAIVPIQLHAVIVYFGDVINRNVQQTALHIFPHGSFYL